MSEQAMVTGAVISRAVARGFLVLETAAHFGGGASDYADMALLVDSLGYPFIPGSSLAGAARAWFCAYLGQWKPEPPAVRQLFGGEDEGQSALIVDDLLIDGASQGQVVLRDGVEIEGKTRTAADGAKYDYEVLERGARFEVELELVIRQGDDAALLRAAFNRLLQALEEGEIHLGARTRRGLGRCRVASWQVLDLTFRDNPAAVLAWLDGKASVGARISRLAIPQSERARVSAALEPKRSLARLSATLRLDGPLLIRSTSTVPEAPDAVHIRSADQPIVPGSSLGGVIRHRAERIAYALAPNDEAAARALLNGLFGFVDKATKPGKASQQASRLQVQEAWITNSEGHVQNRVRIDPLTGGVVTGALFDEMPAWDRADGSTRVQFQADIVEPTNAEIGLLLQVLKDLWTGDLTIGGGSAIGRGALAGQRATLTRLKGKESVEWTWRATATGELVFESGDPEDLESLADALVDCLRNQAKEVKKDGGR